MNTTTNYGLKLYEGTDLFNPLTVENVNTGDIDTALKAVSDHAVGTATELTTGTVHALNRADTDRNVFLFVATSNFTAGDTFTLDGNQVSALTPDGQQLATGSYIIGSTVLCALHDTLITVYVNPAKAKDADMLDGHDSSYYATDSDLDTVSGTIQAVSDKVGTAVLTTTAPDCSGAINELNTHLKGVLVWSNNNPSSAFATQAINVGEHTHYIVIVAEAAGGSNYKYFDIYAGYGNQIEMGKAFAYSNRAYYDHRVCVYNGDGTMSFGNCTREIVGGTTAENNSLLVPMYVLAQ